MDDDIFEWKMEEEVVGELIVDVFLKGEELEEVLQVHKEIRNYPFQPRKLEPDLKNHTTPSITSIYCGPNEARAQTLIMVSGYFATVVWTPFSTAMGFRNHDRPLR
ncbi:hypothetical protein HAX54_046854, partial [Datura stramonium]|nr:hypothetical protein [Datura stramonium]